MTVSLSPTMAAGLMALTSINDDVASIQERLSSGKKVNSALDNPAIYFRSKGLMEKRDAYDQVNSGISAALKNVEVANKGLDTMYSNLNGLLTQLKDAQSKAIAATVSVATTGGMTLGTDATVAGGTSLVDTATPTTPDNSLLFQDGDIFSLTYRQEDGTTATRYFRADSAATATGAQTGIRAGTVAAPDYSQAITFRTVGQLQDAVRRAFGTTDVTLDLAAATPGGQLSMSLKTMAAGTTVSMAQVVDSGVAGPGNAAVDFARIFGSSTNTTLAGGGGSGLTTTPDGIRSVGTMVTYVGANNAASAANLETRRQAADTYRATLQQLANIAKDSYMPGMVNLLGKDSLGVANVMTIDLNEDVGDVVQRVTIGGAVDPAGLGFGGFNAATGDDTQSTTNFNTDTTINNAVTRVNNAMANLRLRQNALATHTTMLTTRLDFNKEFQKLMAAAATEMTAADSAEEAAKLAAAQNCQGFATNNLSVTKQAEQSLLQLLR